jgi:hypothetical protein
LIGIGYALCDRLSVKFIQAAHVAGAMELKMQNAIMSKYSWLSGTMLSWVVLAFQSDV